MTGIRLIAALDCEAKPLLTALRLQRDRNAQGFTVYRNNDGIALLVSGVGRLNAAAAVAYLQGYLPQQTAAWLNIGVAGHASHTLGSSYLMSKIEEAATQRCWYPSVIFPLPCSAALLTTVDRPQTDYPGNALYDMEASGFFATACRFASSELIHVVKVISDNRANPLSEPPKAVDISALIAAAQPVINMLLVQLGALTAELGSLSAPPDQLAGVLSRWRFSNSEQHRLRTLLRRWQLHWPGASLPDSFTDGRALLRWLELELQSAPAYRAATPA